MKVGWAYMAISAILILFGAYLSFEGYDPYGDLVLLSSFVFIYLGANSLADARKAREAAKAAEADSTE
jgi:hypothetical protein